MTVVPTDLLPGLLASMSTSRMCSLNSAEICGLAGITESILSMAEREYEEEMRQLELSVNLRRNEYQKFAADPESTDLLRRLAREWWYPIDETRSLRLLLNDREYSVHIPSRGGGSWALQEVLFYENYRHRAIPVDLIADLGSFVGLSSLYLNSIYPDAQMVCVEPAPPNLEFLEVNLKNNLSSYVIVPSAVAEGATTIRIGINTSPSMGNSSMWSEGAGSRQMISATSLRSVISGESYGIKLDIEGGEFGLQASSDCLIGAKWILGELHFGEFLQPHHSWLVDLLLRHFDMEFSPARFGECGSTYLIAQDFRAYRKR